MPHSDHSIDSLACPLDQGELTFNTEGAFCVDCHTVFPQVLVGESKQIDFRAIGFEETRLFNFIIPVTPLTPRDTLEFGKNIDPNFKSPSRQQLRRRFKSKLSRELIFYCNNLREELGPDMHALDLGCGDGGNTSYLKSLNLTNITKVDFLSASADYQVDVHRMPFKDKSFDLVITTSTIEHFYNPFIAFWEISRVLKPGGALLATGSFWESWHGNSCFHFTPGGLAILCESSDLAVQDMWSGWGFIPSVFSHTTGLQSLKPAMYFLQKVFDRALALARGAEFAQIHKFRTSGSYGVFARKL